MEPLIHIGYQKTGSTFLQFNVFKKEFGFYNPFDRYFSEVVQRLILTNSFEFNAIETRKYFEGKYKNIKETDLRPVISAEDLSGHLVTYRNHEKEVSLRLKETFPKAKVLVIVREQKSIIKSAWRHYLRNNGPQEISRFIGKKEMKPGFSPILRLDKLKYDLLVNHYQELFGKKNVLVLPFELLGHNQNEFIRKILDFSGNDVDTNIQEFTPANLSPSPVELLLRNKVGRYLHRDALGEDKYFLEKVLNRTSPIITKITPNFVNKSIEKKWDTYIEDITNEYYVESNRKLSELTGITLKKYGYPV